MDAYNTFNAPAERPDLSTLISEYIAKRDGGEITREKPNGALEIITTYEGVNAVLAAFDKACSQMVVACTLGTNHSG